MAKTAVVWGHKLFSHTHSYVHEGFARAFQFLGYDVHWLDDTDDVSGIDFSGALFITEGQVDRRIPIRYGLQVRAAQLRRRTLRVGPQQLPDHPGVLREEHAFEV